MKVWPLSDLSPEQIKEWVERTCAEQGVPVGVTDPQVIHNVVVLLRAGRDARK